MSTVDKTEEQQEVLSWRKVVRMVRDIESKSKHLKEASFNLFNHGAELEYALGKEVPKRRIQNRQWGRLDSSKDILGIMLFENYERFG